MLSHQQRRWTDVHDRCEKVLDVKDWEDRLAERRTSVIQTCDAWLQLSGCPEPLRAAWKKQYAEWSKSH